MTILVRPLLVHEARAFLDVHHAAVRGLAAHDYPTEIIEAWAPLPITDKHVERVAMNPAGEIRFAAVIGEDIVGIGAVILARRELRACYVAPHATRQGVGRRIVDEIERTARDNRLDSLWLDSSLAATLFYERLGYVVVRPGVHILGSGQPMACIKMRKNF